MGFAYICNQIINKLIRFRVRNHNHWKQFHRYTIIGQKQSGIFILKCVNLRTVFEASLVEIVNNHQICSGLLSDQACMVGILHAQAVKSKRNNPTLLTSCQLLPICHVLMARYGRYRISYEDREKNLCFVDMKTGRERVMDPREIVALPEYIRQFDSMQALYIGLLATLRTNLLDESLSLPSSKRRPYLRII